MAVCEYSGSEYGHGGYGHSKLGRRPARCSATYHGSTYHGSTYYGSIDYGLRDVALKLRPLVPRLVEGLHAASELEAVVHVHVQKGRELHELRTQRVGEPSSEQSVVSSQ